MENYVTDHDGTLTLFWSSKPIQRAQCMKRVSKMVFDSGYTVTNEPRRTVAHSKNILQIAQSETPKENCAPCGTASCSVFTRDIEIS